ncbi:iron complex transport system substrate-binding protein [Parvibaculum indicum]|uniref:ABC transporter substrate-binding protein n=1 Tax=Parvibaculum indicum TaxID=562969 RepID=UPI00141FBC11|nr:ABC transporter substrate-binding protein [Parvibaculum indicum]NIJ42988.1 iron complex transport system substrate-binding protein [Parvibaculum indicum]
MRLVLAALSLFLLLPLMAGPANARMVTDLAGREVNVPDHVDKVLLGEGRFLPALGILEPEDPVALLSGMMADLELLDPATYHQYADAFPALTRLPTIGRSTTETFSVEKAISLAPDVAIFGISGGHGPSEKSARVIETLQDAGVAVVFIDFRQDPIVNTPKSIALLGEILGREKRAAAFNAFYAAQLDIVESRLADVKERPTVFLESRVGLHDQCCETMGEGMLGRFIGLAGGDNIAIGLVPGVVGTVSIEHLLQVQPDHYVATGIGSSWGDPVKGRVILGTGATMDMAQRSLAEAMERPGLAELDAVREGHVHAIWHHFYNSPFNVVALQEMAKWFHPDLFADLDPRHRLAEAYRRFQPVPLEGAFWASLPEKAQ